MGESIFLYNKYTMKNKSQDSDNKSAWNNHALRYFKKSNFSYKIIDFGDARYATDDDLKLIPDVHGKSILELGCGGANVGIALAKRGAKVTCVDISSVHLDVAKQKAQEHHVEIDFIESSIEKLDFSQFEKFDIVISICALQYVPNLSVTFEKVYNSLHRSGCFIFSTNDPVFYSVASKFLWNEENLQPSYFYQGDEQWKWEEEDDYEFTTYRYPIDYHINNLIKAGFSIDSFHQLQPISNVEESDEGQLENLFPRIMVFKCLA